MAINEKEILKYWEDNDIFEKSIKNREGCPYYSFYDGPPFATGKPHYGHILPTTIKDAVLRYWTMRGFMVPRRVGWDCHGLPVENLIEKELDIKSKKEIEEYGVEKFNDACKNSVLRCTDDFEQTLKRAGRWADYSKTYTTMDNKYIESVWWVLKQLWDLGLVEKRYRVSPYCPRCETTLSNFEVNLGYKDVKDNSIFVEFKIVDEDASLLVWTTTPWTLPGNVALVVNKDEDYCLIDNNGKKYILAKKRLEVVDGEYNILEEFKGKKLIGKEYVPVFDYLKNENPENIQNAFKVFSADFVSMEDGTGIVHIAPMYGEDDYNIGRENDLPFFHTVDESGKFLDFVKDFQGEFVTESNNKIIDNLKERGILYKQEEILHTYPFCWRCDSPLLYYAKESWYIKVSDLRDRLIKNNEEIRWVPEHIKEGRFGKWLEGAKDWNFSRNRFWGAPIPIWECECGYAECIDSMEKLGDVKDLHKPYIDDVVLDCPKCGKKMKRTPEVFDCWFESGSMPYAQWHYPFENKELVEKTFPAHFISEGPDQTRGWFYTLHVLATALTIKNIGLGKDSPAFRNVIVNGLILDEKGRKLSKKLKNYPDVNEVFDEFGADSLRYFLLASTSVGDDYRFSKDGVKEVWRKVISGLENCFVFLKTYKKDYVKTESDVLLDKWILSRLAIVNKEVNKYMEEYELTKASRVFGDFIDDLSNWYIRRSRRRFQKPLSQDDFNKAVSTLEFVLIELSKMMAPFTPFITEHIYRELEGGESVHLCDYPKLKEKEIDEGLDQEMKRVRDIVNLALALRSENRVKVRQPLSVLKIKNKINEGLFELLKEEINVKEVVIDKSIKNEIELDFEITDELREEGTIRELIRHIQQMRKDLKYSPKDRILLKCEGGAIGEDSKQRILEEVLADGFTDETETEKTININGEDIIIGIKKYDK